MANDLLARIDAALAHAVEDRHSIFQLKHFVLGKEGTVQGQLWQCLREIRARKDALGTLTLEIEKSKDQLELLYIHERQAQRSMSRIQRKGWEKSDNMEEEAENEQAYQDEILAVNISLRQVKREIEAVKNSLTSLEGKRKGVEVEADFLVSEFETLAATTPVKSLDDVIAQKEYWTAKLFNEVNLKTLLGLPLDTELVKTVLAMPDETPVKAQMLSFLKAIRDARHSVSNQQKLPQATAEQVK